MWAGRSTSCTPSLRVPDLLSLVRLAQHELALPRRHADATKPGRAFREPHGRLSARQPAMEALRIWSRQLEPHDGARPVRVAGGEGAGKVRRVVPLHEEGEPAMLGRGLE